MKVGTTLHDREMLDVDIHCVQMTDSAVVWLWGCTEPAEIVSKWYIVSTQSQCPPRAQIKWLRL